MKGKMTKARRERIERARNPLASFLKKPSALSVNKSRNPSKSSVRLVRAHVPISGDKEYTVQWDNVTFEDRYLVIRGVVPRKTVHLFYKPARASFNFIKRRIKQRLEPFKIQVGFGVERLVDRIYMDEVVDYMECREELEKLIGSIQPDYRGYYTRIPSHLSALFFPQDKREYLDILCDWQSDNHKIIPVSEIIGTTTEDSFLFTVEREGAMYIVWENTNLSRATYVFRVDPVGYEDRLQFVFDYIVSNVRAKRQRLHSDSIDKDIFGDFEIINHTEIGTWRLRLDHLFAKKK